MRALDVLRLFRVLAADAMAQRIAAGFACMPGNFTRAYMLAMQSVAGEHVLWPKSNLWWMCRSPLVARALVLFDVPIVCGTILPHSVYINQLYGSSILAV